MWVCLQSVLANDEKNVVLLVVKYSHVVLQFFSVIVFCFFYIAASWL